MAASPRAGLFLFNVLAAFSCATGSTTCPAEAVGDEAAMLQKPRGGFYGEPGCAKRAPPKSALIVVDMQYDFINGTLPVTNATEVIPVINDLVALEGWAFVGYTMDWHPHDHASFAESWQGKAPFDVITMDHKEDGKLCGEEAAQAWGASAQSSCDEDDVKTSLEQTLWPTHCVQESKGAEFHHDIEAAHPASAVTVKKGFSSVIDSYGAFENRLGRTESNLGLLMTMAGAETAYITGLALDYCVKFTALQSQDRGFKTMVVMDATKPVADATGEAAVKDMKEGGVEMVSSDSVKCDR